eukprot:12709323-Alexandrium_andersonii.AAC.1
MAAAVASSFVLATTSALASSNCSMGALHLCYGIAQSFVLSASACCSSNPFGNRKGTSRMECLSVLYVPCCLHGCGELAC